MKNKVLALVLTVLAIAILILISYKENGIKTYPVYKTSSMRGFRITHKKDNEIKWELVSENATFPEGNKAIVLKNLSMRIHDKYDMTLTGGSGVYKIKDKNLTINKPIEIDIEGDKLTTDSLTWNGEKELITTKDMITFKGKNFFIEGTGLVAKVRNQQIRILDNVTGIFYR
jgi:LPS export ABC transporter protein LptC